METRIDGPRWWVWAGLLALNFLLLLPNFAFHEGLADALPFTPREHPHGAYAWDLRSAVEYPKALLLRRANPDAFRVAWELLVGVFLAAVTARSARFRLLPWALGALFAFEVLFVWYHHAYEALFHTEAALWEDGSLAVNLFHFVCDRYGRVVGWGGLLAIGVLVMLVGWLTASLFKAIRDHAPNRAGLGRVLAVAVVWGLGSLAWFGLWRDDPVVQVPGKVFFLNYANSVARRARFESIAGSVPDLRYDEFEKVRLAKRPNVHLLMIEAYGQRLVSDPQMKGPFRELTSRMEARFAQKGLQARTAFSRAPIFGGRSWLSIGTVQTGIRLEQPSLYNAMSEVSARLPTLTSFFQQQGYRTVSLQSGNRERVGLQGIDIFRRDTVLEFPEMEYRGTKYGWGQIPDQYSLWFYRQKVLEKERPPYFSFYMSVSTHHDWVAIPFARDWHQLNEPPTVQEVPFEPITGVEGIQDGKPRRYFESVVYEWRALAEYIEAEATEDAIFIIVGDHQPLIERTTDAQFDSDIAAVVEEQTLNTPVHVLSRDAAFVARFEQYGFAPGLFAEPGTAGLLHEGLFSLLVEAFAAHLGDASATSHARYLPQGVGLAGLKR